MEEEESAGEELHDFAGEVLIGEEVDDPEALVACVDSDLCNGAERCESGLCVPGPALDCDDGNPCTDDSCDSGSGCINQDNTLACDESALAISTNCC